MDSRPRKGDRFVVTKDFRTVVLIHWRAPMTTGHEQTVPAGFAFAIDIDPPPSATAAVAIPDRYADWERTLVREADLVADKYGGYSLSISFDDLRSNCSRI